MTTELSGPRRSGRSRLTALLVAGGVTAVVAGAGLVACGSSGSDADSSEPRLSVVDPYIPQPAKTGMAAGYLVVRNDGAAADRLVAISTPLTTTAEIHQTVGNEMRKVDGITIPAHGNGVLARGGAHIMFMETTRTLTKGDTVDVTLTFEKSAPLTVRVPVLGAADRPGDPGTGTPGGGSSGHAGHGG